MAQLFTDPRAQQLTFQPSERWVRARIGITTVIDSRKPLLVWEPGRPIVTYAFPAADVAVAQLSATSAPEGGPSGRSIYYDLEHEGALRRHAAWRWADPELLGHVAFRWDALERWYEEDEEIYVHARDPYHRVDAIASRRAVIVEHAGEVLAATERPVLVFETGLPVRYYIPDGDVSLQRLMPSDTRSGDPYKGSASYRAVCGEDGELADIAWYYPKPLPGLQALEGTTAFFNEMLDITVDGERQERPLTPWSRR